MRLRLRCSSGDLAGGCGNARLFILSFGVRCDSKVRGDDAEHEPRDERLEQCSLAPFRSLLKTLVGVND